MSMKEVIEAATAIALVIIGFALFLKSLPFAFDYVFGPDGVDVYILGRAVRVFRIDKRNIAEALVVSAWDVQGMLLDSFRVLSLANRFKSKGVLIKTDGFLWYGLTPADPGAAVKALRMPHRAR